MWGAWLEGGSDSFRLCGIFIFGLTQGIAVLVTSEIDGGGEVSDVTFPMASAINSWKQKYDIFVLPLWGCMGGGMF